VLGGAGDGVGPESGLPVRVGRGPPGRHSVDDRSVPPKNTEHCEEHQDYGKHDDPEKILLACRELLLHIRLSMAWSRTPSNPPDAPAGRAALH